MTDRTMAVRTILMERWDPIGVRGIHDAADEYDSYVEDVAALIDAGASEAELAAHLTTVQSDWMGLPPSHEGAHARIREAAAALAALRG